MSTPKDPAPVAIIAARIARAYPSLSAFSAASLATELVAIERAQHRHAERCCSGADGGYVKLTPEPTAVGSRPAVMRDRLVHDPDAEQRAGARVWSRVGNWLRRCGELSKTHPNDSAIDLHSDPRGAVLTLRLPGETEARWL